MRIQAQGRQVEQAQRITANVVSSFFTSPDVGLPPAVVMISYLEQMFEQYFQTNGDQDQPSGQFDLTFEDVPELIADVYAHERGD